MQHMYSTCNIHVLIRGIQIHKHAHLHRQWPHNIRYHPKGSFPYTQLCDLDPPCLIRQLFDHGPGFLGHTTVAWHQGEGREHHFIEHGKKAVVDFFLLLRGKLSIVLVGRPAFQEGPTYSQHLGKKRGVQVDLWTKAKKHVKNVMTKLFWF